MKRFGGVEQPGLPRRMPRAGWWPCALLAALTACGGGGSGGSAGDGGEPPNPPQPPDVAEISSAALDRSTAPVLAMAADIDDTGQVAVLFAQPTDGRVALLATQGMPGAVGMAPQFSAPEVIDALAPYNNAGQFALAMSPNGNALALWTVSAPCTATTYNTSGTCTLVYSARRMAGAAWEPPVLVGDTPTDLATGIINDVGDVVVNWPGWTRDAQGVLGNATALAWKPTAATAFVVSAFPTIVQPATGQRGITLDRQGNMVLVSASRSATAIDVVTVRGTQQSGFGTVEVLGPLDSDTGLEGMWGGVNGQVVVFWQRAGSAGTQRWSATLDSPNSAWTVGERGAPQSRSLAGRVNAAVSDTGGFVWYDLDNCQVLRRVAGNWQAPTALAAGLCPRSASFVSVASRSGNVLGALASASAATGNTGQWLAYDGQQGVLQQALTIQGSGNGYLLGVPSSLGGQLLLAENGVATFLTLSALDSLPSAAAPAGVSGTATNLWAVVLKLR